MPTFDIAVGIFGNDRPISLEGIGDLAGDLPQTSPTALEIKRVLTVIKIEVPLFFRHIANHMINSRPDAGRPAGAKKS